MSLRKAIQYQKEKRKEYRDSRAIDGSCGNHKWCPICRSNRTYQAQKLALEAKEDLKLTE